MTPDNAYLLTLKRLGAALLVLGLIDLALFAQAIATQSSYSARFNIIAVIAGVFLLRGSLRAASTVRWLAAIALAALLTTVALLPFIQPLDLTLTQFRLHTGPMLLTLVEYALVAVLLWWIIRQLSGEPVQAAQHAAGIKRRDLRIPAVLGAVLVIGTALFNQTLLRSDHATRAQTLAEQQAGTGYRYHVANLKITTQEQRTTVKAIVIGWNQGEIKPIPIEWQEG